MQVAFTIVGFINDKKQSQLDMITDNLFSDWLREDTSYKREIEFWEDLKNKITSLCDREVIKIEIESENKRK